MNKAYELIKDFVPVPSMLKCRANEDFLIISNHQGEIYYLNNIAKDIWNLLDGNRSVDNISQALLTEYDVDKNECQGDLITFIKDLQWKDVIRLKFPLQQ